MDPRTVATESEAQGFLAQVRAAAVMRGEAGASTGHSSALQDYQMQLMLLEHQNKRRLMLQEEDRIRRGEPRRSRGPSPRPKKPPPLPKPGFASSPTQRAGPVSSPEEKAAPWLPPRHRAEPVSRLENSDSILNDYPIPLLDEKVERSPNRERPGRLDRLSFIYKVFLTVIAIPAALIISWGFLNLVSSFLPNESHSPMWMGSDIGPDGSIRGPVIDLNFPDPAIIHIDGTSYAFATNNRGLGGKMIHVQMATSTDNETWTYSHKDALPVVGKWATGARTWAPDVVQVDDGSFVMYYSEEHRSATWQHCVGVATSKAVQGPYSPLDEPFACPLSEGGAIDPDGFQDVDGKRYVTYKIDGNSQGHGGECGNTADPMVATPIMIQEVEADGITSVSGPIEIIDRDAYDGPLIEAPSLYRSQEGIYFLFYSPGCFTGPLYATAYATADHILGPYTKATRPLFITGDGPGMIGPGGADVIKDGSMIVLHGHLNKQDGYVNYSPRGMFTARLLFDGYEVYAV